MGRAILGSIALGIVGGFAGAFVGDVIFNVSNDHRAIVFGIFLWGASCVGAIWGASSAIVDAIGRHNR